MYLQVAQIDDRCMPKDMKYDYSTVRLIVCKIDNPDVEEKVFIYKNGKMGWDRDTWEEYESLKAG